MASSFGKVIDLILAWEYTLHRGSTLHPRMETNRQLGLFALKFYGRLGPAQRGATIKQEGGRASQHDRMGVQFGNEELNRGWRKRRKERKIIK